MTIYDGFLREGIALVIQQEANDQSTCGMELYVYFVCNGLMHSEQINHISSSKFSVIRHSKNGKKVELFYISPTSRVFASLGLGRALDKNQLYKCI